MSSIGVVSSAGIGRAVSEWVLEGKTSLDFTDFDIRRFGPVYDNDKFLAERSVEVLGTCIKFNFGTYNKYCNLCVEMLMNNPVQLSI